MLTFKAFAIWGRKFTSRPILPGGYKHVSVDDAELETTKRVALTEPSWTIGRKIHLMVAAVSATSDPSLESSISDSSNGGGREWY